MARKDEPVINPQEAAVKKEAASGVKSDTIDNTQPADEASTNATPDERLAGGPAVRASVPDEYSGVVSPSLDPDQQSKK